MGRALVVIVSVVALVAPAPARADDYYVTVFTAESVPFRSTNTHAFASLVRVPAGGGAPVLHDIAWAPANMHVRGITLAPEAGANYPLLTTLDWMRESGWRVSAWGPYRVECELYEKLKAQSEWLSTGKVKYKPTDNFMPRGVAVNCYHALTHPVAPLKRHAGAFTCGDAAGTLVLQCYQPWLINPCKTHDEILTVIGADRYQLARRSFDYRPGRLDAIRSAVGR